MVENAEFYGLKVRTDAYRDALTLNPSLIKNAVVVDVGCGTGILRSVLNPEILLYFLLKTSRISVLLFYHKS